MGDLSNLEDFVDILGCKKKTLSMKYLGLGVLNSRRRQSRTQSLRRWREDTSRMEAGSFI